MHTIQIIISSDCICNVNDWHALAQSWYKYEYFGLNILNIHIPTWKTLYYLIAKDNETKTH